jgi:hypothetical protein
MYQMRLGNHAVVIQIASVHLGQCFAIEVAVHHGPNAGEDAKTTAIKPNIQRQPPYWPFLLRGASASKVYRQ